MGAKRISCAFHDQYLTDTGFAAKFRGCLIFRRTITGERNIVALEFDYDIAAPPLAFDRFALSAAHDEFGAIFLIGRGRGRDIGLISLRVLHIDARDPIAFGHQAARSNLRLTRHSAIWIAFSAAPLRRLSETIQSDRPCSTVGSLRM